MIRSQGHWLAWLAAVALAGCSSDDPAAPAPLVCETEPAQQAAGPSPNVPIAATAGFALDFSQRQVLQAQVGATDADGDGLTYSVVAPPANGFVQMEPDGRFHYAPRCGFTGADTFTFRANDGRNDSASATVTVTTAGSLAAFQRARQITAATLETDRIPGPLARGGIGDFVLENEQIKVIIQRSGRQWATINPYGGTLIDAVPRCSNNGVPLDHFEEHATGVNIETAPNPTSILIVNDGSNGQAAVVRATGPDDLIDFINGSSAVRNLGFTFPASADDVDLPVTIETTYTLAPGAKHVKIDLKITYTGSQPKNIYLVEYLNGSGEVEAFQHGYGFGEPLVALPCSGAPPLTATATAPGNLDPCNYVAYAGNDGGAGVSYGFIHDENGTSSVSVSGVTVPALGQNVVTVFAGADTPNYTLTPSPGPAFTQSRYFAVGQGTVAHILDIRNQLYGIATGTLTGTVTSGGQPVANAEIAVIGPDYAPGPAMNVVNHYRTGIDGTYRMTLPPGSYSVHLNKDGRLTGAGNPASANVGPAQTVTVNFDIPSAARLRVLAIDENRRPIAAKVQLVGFDGSPPMANDGSIQGVLTQSTGVFGDLDADRLPFGIAFTEFIDKTGDSGEWEMEPGDYQLVVSHGPRYSVYRQNVPLAPGTPTDVTAQIAKVVPTPGYVTGDFHVHAIDSPDSEVTLVERVLTYLSEGVDFFTPSDHEKRVDFAPSLAAMQVAHLIGTAPSAEITTFDYGHYNSWPVSVMPGLLGGGTVDWGGEAPVGEDFPSAGHYVLRPQEIVDTAKADPRGNLVQINHINSHFGAEGLGIDTGMVPPASRAPAEERRLDPSFTNFFTDHFDALEIWIGVDGRNENADTGAPYRYLMEQNLGDWFNMINQGIVRAAVADSDTHERRLTSLSTRTLIPSCLLSPGRLSGYAEALAATLASGHGIGTNAPFVTISASALSTGQTAGLGLGQSKALRTTDGSVGVTIDVKSPLWAPYDRVELYINNKPTLQSGHYRACPNKKMDRADPVTNPATQFAVQTETPFPAIPGAGRLESTATFQLTALTKDTWIVAMVRGRDGVSAPLFPVVPNDLASGGDNTTLAGLTEADGNVGEKGMPTLAFTNPIFVDVDGNGWAPLGVAAQELESGTCD